jgi:hypothetical protein
LRCRQEEVSWALLLYASREGNMELAVVIVVVVVAGALIPGSPKIHFFR